MSMQDVSTQLHNVASQIDAIVNGFSKLQAAATTAQTLPILVTINNASYSVNDTITQQIIQQGIANQQAPLTSEYQTLINNLVTCLQSVQQSF
jgi:hypothetical protein